MGKLKDHYLRQEEAETPIRAERIAELRERANTDVIQAQADVTTAGRRDLDPNKGLLTGEDAAEILRVYGPELFETDERDAYLRHARAALEAPKGR